MITSVLKMIKKVKISNLPKTEGSIVDSLNSNVDETSNAPSIRAVKESLKNCVKKDEMDQIAILNGDIAVPSASELNLSDVSKWGTQTKTIEYPVGFNANNCVVQSIGVKVSTSQIGYCFGDSAKTLIDLQRNAFPANVILNSENIMIALKNPMPSQVTLNYKIALLKVS